MLLFKFANHKFDTLYDQQLGDSKTKTPSCSKAKCKYVPAFFRLETR